MFAVDNSQDLDLAKQFLKHLEQFDMGRPSYCLVGDKVYKIISDEPEKLTAQAKGSLRTIVVPKNSKTWVYLPVSLNDYCRSLFS
jgi:hypothetical protein